MGVTTSRVVEVPVGTHPGLAVLVVEDEPLIAMDVVDIIAELGHVVMAAVPTAEEALREIGRQRPDVVLLDINLRGELSYEVAHHCTAGGIPVVLTTGYDPTDIPANLRHCRIVKKPFHPHELGGAIEAAVKAG